MNVIVIVAIILAVLFALAFFTKRRFGVLGLALTAGSVLSQLWTDTATPLVEQLGLQVVAPPLSVIVATAIIIMPAVLLLFSGPKYTKMPQRIIGALAFALLAFAFMTDSLGSAMALEGDSKTYFDAIVSNASYIITAGIVFALFDVLSIKKPKPENH
ncbi:MAG: hypothetical protein EOO17_03545 [Chloroflexi bacterium]|nr:MAG: hypothetical protein EOO17_03545 [Chloroflexota bacterium]